MTALVAGEAIAAILNCQNRLHEVERKQDDVANRIDWDEFTERTLDSLDQRFMELVKSITRDLKQDVTKCKRHATSKLKDAKNHIDSSFDDIVESVRKQITKEVKSLVNKDIEKIIGQVRDMKMLEFKSMRDSYEQMKARMKELERGNREILAAAAQLEKWREDIMQALGTR